jgi:hypothetical protein
MTEVDLSGATWHKSRRSGAEGNCVEVADNLPHIVAVRDTKDRDGGTLTFSPGVWSAFLDDIKAGKFDI